MARKEEIISIPSSPASTNTEPSPSSVASSTETEYPSSPKADRTERKLKNLQKLHIHDRLKKCRDKTLESEICRTMSRFMRNCMSDDQSRRFIAIAIMILAVIGLYHVLISIF